MDHSSRLLWHSYYNFRFNSIFDELKGQWFALQCSSFSVTRWRGATYSVEDARYSSCVSEALKTNTEYSKKCQKHVVSVWQGYKNRLRSCTSHHHVTFGHHMNQVDDWLRFFRWTKTSKPHHSCHVRIYFNLLFCSLLFLLKEEEK